MMFDVDLVQFFWQRASYPIFKQYGLNARELWFLRALHFALRYRGKSVVSKTNFFRELTGNRKRWGYYDGYRRGLVNKKMVEVYEYTRKPGSECLGISPLGFAVLRHHERVLRDLCAQYPEPRNVGEVTDFFRQTA
jgi:hypothetical protein